MSAIGISTLPFVHEAENRYEGGEIFYQQVLSVFLIASS
jgi:hypothetical protein